MLIDTHCHIHRNDYPLNRDEVIDRAVKNGVGQLICIGTDEADSTMAVDFAVKYDNVFASVGVHPHEVKNGWNKIVEFLKDKNSKIIAIGEIGLDYHYDLSPRDIQIQALKDQIKIAQQYDLPIIFHVRDAFDDFWTIFDECQLEGNAIRGVVHCFTDFADNAQKCLDRGLYIGVGGFSTFVKDESQKAMFASLPIDKILLETDAPYLTPVPFRGKVNEPAFVRNIAVYQAEIRNISLDEIIKNTTANARALFKI